MKMTLPNGCIVEGTPEQLVEFYNKLYPKFEFTYTPPHKTLCDRATWDSSASSATYCNAVVIKKEVIVDAN